MSRIDSTRWNSKPKHEDFQINLLKLLVDFETTVMFNEHPCYALRRQMIDLLQTGRQEIELCTTSFNDLMRYGQPKQTSEHLHENRWPNHMEMLHWINDMSITCKLANLPPNEVMKIIERTQKPPDATKLTDLGFLQRGKELAAQLDQCREPRFYDKGRFVNEPE